MEKEKRQGCDCRTIIPESVSADIEGASHCNCESYACDRFHDPKWLKINIDYFPAGFEAPEGIFRNISPSEASRMLIRDPHGIRWLDVKTEAEFRARHLPGSLNLDFFSPTFKDDLFALDKGARYVVICKIGMRSEIAMNLMRKMGFVEVYNVAGGDDRWEAEEIPYGESRPVAACCN